MTNNHEIIVYGIMGLVVLVILQQYGGYILAALALYGAWYIYCSQQGGPRR